MSPTIILAVLLGLSALGNLALGKLYVGAKADIARVQQAFDSFSDGVEVAGEEQNRKAAEQAKLDKEKKEKADEEHKKTTAALVVALAELRKRADTRPGRGQLPAAPTDTKRPDLLCLDRAEYQRTYGEAVGRLREGSRGLADEGTTNTVDLDTAKKWACKQ